MRETNQDVIFVNTLIGRGLLNNVVNLTFGTFLFSPVENGSVDVDQVISVRLRMDLDCARSLHKELGDFLGLVERESGSPAPAPTPAVVDLPAAAPESKPRTPRVKAH